MKTEGDKTAAKMLPERKRNIAMWRSKKSEVPSWYFCYDEAKEKRDTGREQRSIQDKRAENHALQRKTEQDQLK